MGRAAHLARESRPSLRVVPCSAAQSAGASERGLGRAGGCTVLAGRSRRGATAPSMTRPARARAARRRGSPRASPPRSPSTSPPARRVFARNADAVARARLEREAAASPTARSSSSARRTGSTPRCSARGARSAASGRARSSSRATATRRSTTADLQRASPAKLRRSGIRTRDRPRRRRRLVVRRAAGRRPAGGPPSTAIESPPLSALVVNRGDPRRRLARDPALAAAALFDRAAPRRAESPRATRRSARAGRARSRSRPIDSQPLSRILRLHGRARATTSPPRWC